MHRTRIVLATVLVALTGAATAQAKPFVNHDFVFATSAVDVIGFGAGGTCPGSTDEESTPVQASHDRGSSWTVGACLGNGAQLVFDVATGTVYGLEIVSGNGPGGRLVLEKFDADAHVAASTD